MNFLNRRPQKLYLHSSFFMFVLLMSVLSRFAPPVNGQLTQARASGSIVTWYERAVEYNVDISSTSFKSIPHMSISFDTATTANLQIVFSATISMPDGYMMDVEPVVDGDFGKALGPRSFAANAPSYDSRSAQWIVTNLPAGHHKVTMHARVSGGIGIMGYRSMTLAVIDPSITPVVWYGVAVEDNIEIKSTTFEGIPDMWATFQTTTMTNLQIVFSASIKMDDRWTMDARPEVDGDLDVAQGPYAFAGNAPLYDSRSAQWIVHNLPVGAHNVTMKAVANGESGIIGYRSMTISLIDASVTPTRWYEVSISNNIETNSTSFEDVPGMSIFFTTTELTNLQVVFSSTIVMANGHTMDIDIVVDGDESKAFGPFGFAANAPSYDSRLAQWIVRNLPAGSHHIKLHARVTGGTGTVGYRTMTAKLAPAKCTNADSITIWEDDFEGYDVGAFPSPPWEWWFDGAGLGCNGIVNAIFHSPNQSFTMRGQPGWASVAAVQLPDISDIINVSGIVGYEVWVRAENYGSGTGAWVGFSTIRYGAIWTGWAGVAFSYDGQIVSGSTILQSYDLNTWYKIRVAFDINRRRYSVWINEVLKAAELEENNPEDPKTKLRYFGLASDHGQQQCYFDDAKVFKASNIAARFELKLDRASLTMNLNQSAQVNISVVSLFGFDSYVDLVVEGIPENTVIALSTYSIKPGQNSTLTISTSYGTPVKSHLLTVSGNSGSLSAVQPIEVVVVGEGPFEIRCPRSLTVYCGDFISVPIYVVCKNQWRSPINWSILLAPSLSASFNPTSMKPNETSTMTITVSSNVSQSFQNLTLVGTSEDFSYAYADIYLTVLYKEPPAWMQSWFWILLGSVAGIVVSSSAVSHYYRKWRRAKKQLDIDYLVAANSLAKLEELKLLGRVSQQEYEARKKEYERTLRGE
jgi:hypothetical protein